MLEHTCMLSVLIVFVIFKTRKSVEDEMFRPFPSTNQVTTVLKLQQLFVFSSRTLWIKYWLQSHFQTHLSLPASVVERVEQLLLVCRLWI